MMAAKRRGVRPRRKLGLTEEQVARASRLIDGGESPRLVAKVPRVRRSTLYRHLPGGKAGRLPA